MVTWLADRMIAGPAWLLAQEKAQQELQRLPPLLRAKLLAALAAFIILGFGMIALVWLGARVTRRYMKQEPLRKLLLPQLQDDWAGKPLVKSDDEVDE